MHTEIFFVTIKLVIMSGTSSIAQIFTSLSSHSKNNNKELRDQLSLNAGQKYCRMLQGGAFCNTFDLH